uniref:RING-type domain-containing protein n=1 Tax=Panagrolaimus sp. JU765 TaxID=591449 RepID=A0AC34QEI5_9BILA
MTDVSRKISDVVLLTDEDDENKCVICIQTGLQDPTILNTCHHFYCFECIEQWMYTNPCCPMCKIPLEKMKHRLRPVPSKFPVEYDQIDGEEVVVEDMLDAFELEGIKNANASSLHVEERAVQKVIADLNHKLEIQLRLLGGNIISKADKDKHEKEIRETIKRYNLLLNKIRTNCPRSEIYNTYEFRRIIYRCNLAPRSRVAPKFPMDVSADSIKTNFKKIKSRLIPYLIREISAILSRIAIDMEPILKNIMNYLIDGTRAARAQLVGYLTGIGVPHPSHFINNMMHFIGSGEKLHVYDENSEYVSRRVGDIRSYFDEEGGDVQVLTENVRRERLPRMDDDRLLALNQRYYDGYNPIDVYRHGNRRRRRSRSDSPIVVHDEDNLSGPNSSNVVELSDEDSEEDDLVSPPTRFAHEDDSTSQTSRFTRFYRDYLPSFYIPRYFPFQNQNQGSSVAQQARALLDTLSSTNQRNENSRSRRNQNPGSNPPPLIDMFEDSPHLNRTVEISDSPMPSNSQPESLSNRTQNDRDILIDDDSDIEVIDRPTLSKRPRIQDL